MSHSTLHRLLYIKKAETKVTVTPKKKLKINNVWWGERGDSDLVTLASPLPERVNKWTRRRHVIIVRQARLWLQAVHLLQADILHQMVLAVLPPAGDVLHVVRVIHRLVPRLVPLHLTVTSQWVLCIIIVLLYYIFLTVYFIVKQWIIKISPLH